MPPKGTALIRDLPPVVDLRPVPPPPTPAAALRSRVVETPPGPDGRPRAPRREVELAVPGYPGFQVWLWANYPQRIRLDLTSGEEERVRACLARLVVEHNGWCDADGEPYPPADDAGFWEAIPTELGQILAVLVLRDAPGVFPKSVSQPDAS